MANSLGRHFTKTSQSGDEEEEAEEEEKAKEVKKVISKEEKEKEREKKSSSTSSPASSQESSQKKRVTPKTTSSSSTENPKVTELRKEWQTLSETFRKTIAKSIDELKVKSPGDLQESGYPYLLPLLLSALLILVFISPLYREMEVDC
jgi:cobalamin biosynthesis Mg chelatase CobN